jgi:hypothetical protein
VEVIVWQNKTKRRGWKKIQKIAPLFKLVLEVIPHIIKNQLTLYDDANERLRTMLKLRME